MIAHPSVDDLSAYLDGELPGDRIAALEAHLRTCAGCASWLDDVRASESLVGALPAEAPAGYHEGFVDRLRPRLAARKTRRPWAWSAAAAAALLAVVLVPAVLREKSSLAPVPSHDAALPQAPAPDAGKNAVPPPLQAAPPREQESGGARPPAAPPAFPRPEPKRQAEGSGGRADADFAEAPQKKLAEPPQKKKDAALPPPAAGMAQAADEERALARDAVAAEAVGKLEESVPAPTAAATANEHDAAPERQKAAVSQDRAESRLAAGAPAAAPARSRAAEIAELRRQREDWRRKAAAGKEGDASRLQVVELGLRIYRLSGAAEDRRQALADAEAYLADPGAEDAARVRDLRRQIER
jgi:hypothetical protein